MAACTEEWFESLSAYRDGEVTAADAARIEAHVDGCAACRHALERLAAAGDALVRAHALDVPPRTLDRARSAISAARSRRRVPRMVLFAAAAAAAAAALLVSLRHRGLEPAMADDLVMHHVRGFARDKPTDFETRDPVAAAAWLEAKLGYRVRVPVPEGAVLLGARLCSIEGVRTAALLYRGSAAPLTIFVPPSGSAPAAHAASFAGHEVRCTQGALHTRICVVSADQPMAAVADGTDEKALAATLAAR